MLITQHEDCFNIFLQAFKKAWKKACATSGAVLLVPSNKNYLLKPITFSGPCNTALTIEVIIYIFFEILQQIIKLEYIYIFSRPNSMQ